jgi:aminopeptidase N
MMLLRDSHGPAMMVKRSDYSAPAFWVDTVDLTFDLDPAKTRVLNRMRLRRNPGVTPQALRLDGEELNLARVLVNGQGTSFKIEGDKLVLENLPEGNDPFDLEIFTTCAPVKNTKLMGLYVSADSFFTQCEAEGFRRITYFLDRPDVMASYTVTLRADKAKYPVLLSNGNLVDSGDLTGADNAGRHFAKWVDPHKKPCYLFALVAGELVAREQRITSRAGKDHLLQVYVRPGDLDKTEHAMNSLMASVAWDEARFGLPLDLDRFMVVATSDFNMGAMENKGLNIFNTKYVLANAATATDADFSAIESVVGHEYFHNWTGNRVTCRDWFQLSLKEGLTVFRDQEFSARPVRAMTRRPAPSNALKTCVCCAPPSSRKTQAPWPTRCARTATSRSATSTPSPSTKRVPRWCACSTPWWAATAFAKGMKLYFERFDGQAVTCDDFAQSMADANPGSSLAALLPQFKLWYSQAGTPRLHARGEFDAAQRTYTLHFTQRCAPTPGQTVKAPFVIPVLLGLVGQDGSALPLQLHGSSEAPADNHLFVMTGETASITFTHIDAEPVPSILRGFSAPVTLDFDYSDAQLLTLLANDPDPFNRWEAGQRLALRSAIKSIAGDAQSTSANPLNDAYLEAMRSVLRHPTLDAAFKDLVLTLPSEAYIAEQLDVVDPQRIHAVREAMRMQLAQSLHTDWAWAVTAHQDNGAYRPDPVSSGRRALTGMAQYFLCLAATQSGDTVWPGKTLQRFKDASNMTDRFNALLALVVSGHPLGEAALARFHALFKHEALVIDKWFALQASTPDRGGRVLPAVRQLMAHPDFNIRNPNRARSVIFS